MAQTKHRIPLGRLSLLGSSAVFLALMAGSALAQDTGNTPAPPNPAAAAAAFAGCGLVFLFAFLLVLAINIAILVWVAREGLPIFQAASRVDQ